MGSLKMVVLSNWSSLFTNLRTRFYGIFLIANGSKFTNIIYYMRGFSLCRAKNEEKIYSLQQTKKYSETHQNVIKCTKIFFATDFFSKCSYLLKKYFMENFIFCAMITINYKDILNPWKPAMDIKWIIIMMKNLLQKLCNFTLSPSGI